MSKYLVTVKVEFEAADDIAARELANKIKSTVGERPEVFEPKSTGIKLQRLEAGKPPTGIAIDAPPFTQGVNP